MVYCIYFLGTLPIYFIALIWGNGDAERKSSDQILFIHCRFFIHAYCFCLPISKAGSFLIQDLYDLDLTRTEQFWIFWAFSWLMQLN
jgi:NADH-quinone oxidoreductase subunit M